MTASPPGTLLSPATLRAILDLAVQSPRGGAFVELGVYQGGSAWHLAQVARARKAPLHLFDTFRGIPEAGPLDHEHKVGDFADTSFENVLCLIPDAIFHVGQFPRTMSSAITDISFAHIDCDQYAPCEAALRLFWPRLMPGGMMAFDDYGTTTGVTTAVNEWLIEAIRKSWRFRMGNTTERRIYLARTI